MDTVTTPDEAFWQLVDLEDGLEAVTGSDWEPFQGTSEATTNSGCGAGELWIDRNRDGRRSASLVESVRSAENYFGSLGWEVVGGLSNEASGGGYVFRDEAGNLTGVQVIGDGPGNLSILFLATEEGLLRMSGYSACVPGDPDAPWTAPTTR